MPQMMPLNWVSMMMTINFLLILFTTIMFNSFTPMAKNMYMYKMMTPMKKWSW